MNPASATSNIKREQGLNYLIKYVLCLDATMLRKFENENKNQNKKNLRLKIYEKRRNDRLKLERSVLIKRKTCTRISTHVVRTNNEWRYGSGAGRITTAFGLTLLGEELHYDAEKLNVLRDSRRCH